MSFWDKAYFYIHNSIFLQMGILFLFLGLVFIYVHIKCRKYAESNLENLINQTANTSFEKGIIEGSDKLSIIGKLQI